jgi:hypothetical protein
VTSSFSQPAKSARNRRLLSIDLGQIAMVPQFALMPLDSVTSFICSITVPG